MNAMPLAASRPLLDMLGARWMVGARATGVRGTVPRRMRRHSGSRDGSLAVARLAWDGGPTVRARGGGGVELVPRSAPPPAVARIPVARRRVPRRSRPTRTAASCPAARTGNWRACRRTE